MSRNINAIEESCAYLLRFLNGERGFTTDDVLAGMRRLRELDRLDSNAMDRSLAKEYVRRACEKLNRKDDNYKWACEA